MYIKLVARANYFAWWNKQQQPGNIVFWIFRFLFRSFLPYSHSQCCMNEFGVFSAYMHTETTKENETNKKNFKILERHNKTGKTFNGVSVKKFFIRKLIFIVLVMICMRKHYKTYSFRTIFFSLCISSQQKEKKSTQETINLIIIISIKWMIKLLILLINNFLLFYLFYFFWTNLVNKRNIKVIHFVSRHFIFFSLHKFHYLSSKAFKNRHICLSQYW